MDEYAILFVPNTSRTAAQDWAQTELGGAASRAMFSRLRLSANGATPVGGWLSHLQTNAARQAKLSTFTTIPGVRWARVDIDTGVYKAGNVGGTVGQPFTIADFLAAVGMQFIPAR